MRPDHVICDSDQPVPDPCQIEAPPHSLFSVGLFALVLAGLSMSSRLKVPPSPNQCGPAHPRVSRAKHVILIEGPPVP